MAAIDFKSDKRIPEDARKKLRAFCGDLGEDIVALAIDLGVSVFADDDLLPYESGALKFDPFCGSRSKYKIVVNPRHSPERQRFTIAHELAHFLLHRDDSAFGPLPETIHRDENGFRYIDQPDPGREREANRFASALLMPPNLFAPAFRRFNGDVASLAKLFGVSERAASIRVTELRLR